MTSSTRPVVIVDRELCIGSENCTRYAPTTLRTDEHNVAVVLADSTDDEQAIRLAVSACPMGALRIVEHP